jgi:hypothetical protein
MAERGTTARTLTDWANEYGENSTQAVVIEMLSRTNEILLDMPFMESNLATGHLDLIRTGLPSATWRSFNQGVPSSKAAVAKVTFATGMLEARSHVDKDLAELNGNLAQYRADQAAPFVETMNQQMAEKMWYGNEALAPSEITGFARYYSTVNPANAASAEMVVDAGGTGTDNTSVWLINWSTGSTGINGIFPKGSKAGLEHQDLGEDDQLDAAGNPFRAYKDLWKWKCGLRLGDWRDASRIANIDVSDLRDGGATGVTATQNLIRNMVIASEKKDRDGGYWYMNKVARTALRLGILNRVSNNLTFETVEGKKVMMFDGMPIRRTDSLLLTEARVV